MPGFRTPDDRCDLDPNKICDNCCKCIDNSDSDYKVVLADMALDESEGYLVEKAGETESDDVEERYIGVPDELLAEWNDKLQKYEQELSDNEADKRVMVGHRKRK